MDLRLFEADLTHLDSHSLEKIAHIAAQARRSLLIGIASIRTTDETTAETPPPSSDTDLMVAQLGKLTLMWDEIHHRARRLLTDDGMQTDDWSPKSKPYKFPPVTLH
ncbi:MAG: hypothetical protein HQL86_05865 [Magnetococcales bacterium]|nr:hypothetical protein [Magnetococcales bacterium]